MAVDWSRGDLLHSVRVQQVDPGDMTTIRGELSGVRGGTLELSYYGDTRMAASIETMGVHGWDGSAALRIVHDVRDYTGLLLRETLFTGFVTASPWDGTGDAMVTKFSLASSLRAWSEGVCRGLTLGAGTKALDGLRLIASSTGRILSIDGDATDYMMGGAYVRKAGDSWLSIAYDLADKAGDRLSVDENGIITVSRYGAPSVRVPDWTVDPTDPRGTIVGQPSGDTDALTRPTSVVVYSEQGDESVIGSATVAAGDPASRGVRGYDLDRFESLTDLSPFTDEAARQKATALLLESASEQLTLSHGLMYRPLREGMVEQWRDGGRLTRWQVSNAQLDLKEWVWKLDLKGGWTT